MANRPVYIPKTNSESVGVTTKDVEFEWFPGMSKSQKQKSILSLHEASYKLDISPLLEISSKSMVELARRLIGAGKKRHQIKRIWGFD